MPINLIPDSSDPNDDYVSRPADKEPVPVQKDDAPVEDPIDADRADGDEQLGS